MINITDPSKCCGCTACVNLCPVQCIVMRRDQEGFDYPIANPDLCIGCGSCDDVCPMQRTQPAAEVPEAYAVRIDEFVDASSSGGVFPALAKQVVSKGGKVFGAVLEEDMKIAHVEASTEAEIERMRGSKYAQSELYSVFEDVKNTLAEGEYVMFTGTPCQVAALNGYIGKADEKLLTVDIACHGVAAPGLWERYVRALEKKYGKQIADVSFRDKTRGWRHYGMKLTFADGSSRYTPRENDPYLSLFMQRLTFRPSCYECKFKCGRSGSDITLSQLWCVHELVPQLNDDRGVSGVFLNTDKGISAFSTLGVDKVIKVDAYAARSCNGGFMSSAPIPEKRDEFFAGAHLTTDILRHMSRYVIRIPLYKRVYLQARTLMSKIKRGLIK